MLTYPKSTMRVRRMPMHLSSGHETLMPGKLYLSPLISPQSDLGRRADSRWALPQISSFFIVWRQNRSKRQPTCRFQTSKMHSARASYYCENSLAYLAFKTMKSINPNRYSRNTQLTKSHCFKNSSISTDCDRKPHPFITIIHKTRSFTCLPVRAQ